MSRNHVFKVALTGKGHGMPEKCLLVMLDGLFYLQFLCAAVPYASPRLLLDLAAKDRQPLTPNWLLASAH